MADDESKVQALAKMLGPTESDPTGMIRAKAVLAPKVFKTDVYERMELVDGLNRLVARLANEKLAVTLVKPIADLAGVEISFYADGRLESIGKALSAVFDLADDMGIERV